MYNVDLEKLNQSCAKLKDWLGSDTPPDVGVVLGSGLGNFAANFPNARCVDYKELGFVAPAVVGHAGKLYLVEVGGKKVVLLSGRVHYYEGYDLQETVFNVRVLSQLGIKNFVITCAAGSVTPDYHPGEIVIIKDHLNLAFVSPLRGQNYDALGPRFPGLSVVYDNDFIHLAQEAAEQTLGHNLKEGVYAMMPGPAYETKAEVKMLKILGADLAGMSTVPEVVALKHTGARVLGLSLVTNYAAGVVDEEVDHNQVIKIAAESQKKFSGFLTKVLEKIPRGSL